MTAMTSSWTVILDENAKILPLGDKIPESVEVSHLHRQVQKTLKTNNRIRSWVRMSIVPSAFFRETVIEGIFQKRDVLPKTEFLKIWQTLFEPPSKAPRLPVIGKNDRLTRDAALRWVHEIPASQLTSLALPLNPSSLLEDALVGGNRTLYVTQVDNTGLDTLKPTMRAWAEACHATVVSPPPPGNTTTQGAFNLSRLNIRIPIPNRVSPQFLSELFSTFRLSAKIPLISLYSTHDANDLSTPTGTHRFLSESKIPIQQLRLWVRPILSTSKTPQTFLRILVMLKPYVRGYKPLYVQVILRQITGGTNITGNMRITNFGHMDLRASHEEIASIIRKAFAEVGDPILINCSQWFSSLLRTFMTKSESIDVITTSLMTTTYPIQALPTGSMTSVLPLYIPFASLLTRLVRFHAWFTLVTHTSDRMVLMYHAVSGASNRRRISNVIKLLWNRPRDALIADLQVMFPVDEAMAGYLVDQADRSKRIYPNDWIHYNDPCPLVTISTKVRHETTVQIQNVTRYIYIYRILDLLSTLMAVGGLPDDFPAAFTATKSPRPRDGKLSEEVKALLDQELVASGSETPVDELDEGLPYSIEDDAAANIIASSSASSAAATSEGEAPGPSDDGLLTERTDFVPSMYVLRQLHRADLSLFKFEGTRYATICGKNNMRQPIVLSRSELERIERDYPGSHTGALLDHGSSTDLASKNAYICPKVWCIKSRTALNMKQFSELGRKCPGGPDDFPIVYDTGYFKGRERYIGLIDAHHHPQNLNMPCCFLKPSRIHVKSNQTQNKSSTYIRMNTIPVERDRYGMLPDDLVQLLHLDVKKSCGSRDDGSGQITMNSKCYVHRGIVQNVGGQNLLSCLSVILNCPGAPDAESLVQVIVKNLTVIDFLQLQEGRLARKYMSHIDPIRDVLESPEALADLKSWLKSGASGYVHSLQLEHVVLEAQRFTGRTPPSLELQREALVRAGLLKYLSMLSDKNIIKMPSDGLIELASRPLEWLNPHRCNFIVLERNASDSSSIIACPHNPPSHAWRSSDPISLILRQDEFFEPIVYLRMQKGRINETVHMNPMHHPRVARLIRILRGTCAPETMDKVTLLYSSILSAMDLEGKPATTQVMNYMFQLVGFLSSSNVFVPISYADVALPLLIGNVGMKLGLVYQSELPKRCKQTNALDAKKLLIAIANRVADYSLQPRSWVIRKPDASLEDKLILTNNRPPQQVVALRTSGGMLVPTAGFLDALADPKTRAKWLEPLSLLVTTSSDVQPSAPFASTSDLLRKLMKDIRMSDDLSSSLRILRNTLYPLTVTQRRRIALDLFGPVIAGSASGLSVARTIDWLLFSSLRVSKTSPQNQDSQSKILAVVTFTDIDVASGMLSKVLQMGDPDNQPMVPSDNIIEVDLPMDRSLVRTRLSSTSKRTVSMTHTIMNDIDVYVAIHLAHYILNSDAAYQLSAGISSVQNAILNRGKESHPSLPAIESYSTLGRLLAANTAIGMILSKISDHASTSYVPSTFEISVLSGFFDVDVRIRDGMYGVPVSVYPSSRPSKPSYLLLQRSVENHKFSVIWQRLPSTELSLFHSS